ncbi:MAG: DMT family transporter [Candidatus Competibacterales bacterium]
MVGFAGAVVFLNPTTAPDPAMGAALTAALLYALSLIITKRLSTTESPALLMFYFGVVTSLASMPLALWMWRPPGLVDMVLLVVVAVCATARVYCDIRGFSLGEASFVGPFQYLRILLGALGAYWLFAEIPDLNTWAGAALIIASTLYIAQREWRLKRQQRRASSLPEPHTKAPNP